MVHQYKLNGYNIVLDVQSGAIHVVDEVTYDLIAIFENNSKEYVVDEIHKKYSDIPKNDTEDLLLLEHMGLVDVKWCEFGYAIIANLSNKGVAYMRVNPKLKDPSILDDKKFWINTAISFVALVVAIIALFKETF